MKFNLMAIFVVLVLFMLAGCGESKQAKGHREFNKWLVSEVSRAGLIEHGSEIEAFVSDVKGLTPKDAAVALLSIAEGCPKEQLSRQFAIVRHIAPVRPMFDDQRFRELCKLCGSMASMAPSMADDDIADMGLLVFKHFQKFTRKPPPYECVTAVNKMVTANGGIPINEAWAIAMKAAEEGRLEFVPKLAEALTAKQ